jgi:tetratricopeptide (TPR) repeat protein
MMNSNAPIDLDATLDRQKNAWFAGVRPRIDDLLRDSALPSSPDVLLDLIYNEIVVREELGEDPSIDEYVGRYPDLDEDLKLHFEIHRAMQENLLDDTYCTDNVGTQLDLTPARPGPSLADYDIVSELGRGGMGVVYKARHRRLGRFVALKMFQPGRPPSQRELARFRSEAATIARLDHANIVQIFEIGEDHGLPFLALELAGRGTLQQQLRDLPYESRKAALLIETLARAIQHAHEHHVIHRDLKPANVLFAADGSPKITDFGLAKILEEDSDTPHDATRTGEPIGTPRYMSPEQAAGKLGQIGPATDIYGLGTLLYECLTGQAPFVSASVIETVVRIRSEDPVPPRRLQRSIPRDLETICLKCLHKEPTRRYESAQALADDLERFLDGEPIRARRTPLWEQTWMWCRRRPALATLMSASAGLMLCALVFFAIRQHAERQRIASLRVEVGALVKEGQGALLRGDGRVAKERFQLALAKVQAEPVLSDHELGVRGWLDHSHRGANLQFVRQRNAPPLFDDRRDEAFIRAALSDSKLPESIRDAHQAIADALEFTAVDGPAWRLEREALLVLAADLALRQNDAAKALAILDQATEIATPLACLRRANVLDQLGRTIEAKQARDRAKGLAPQESIEAIFRGLEHLWSQQPDVAIRDFDRTLAIEPERFLARFLQAKCFLDLRRASEAKVALTACIAQRPRFVWNHLLRAKAYLVLEDVVAAAQDLQSASELTLDEAAKQELDRAVTFVNNAIRSLPPDRQYALWNEKISTENGAQALFETNLFGKAKEKPDER